MKSTFLLSIFFFSILSFGQTKLEYALIDRQISTIPNSSTHSTEDIANYINTNFKTDPDKIRAVFYWTASNITYDITNINVVDYTESPQDKISKTLKSKKGLCIHYAEVFNDLSNKIGIQSYIIEGYTKQNGKVATLSHAWCAAKIDSKWYLFDPTWGAGYVSNGKFFKKLNNSYFKVEPYKMISSHIPFDYLWQFLNYPITNQEFYDGKTQTNKSKKYFDFEKELAKYNSLTEVHQVFESAERIQKNGIKNALILERLEGKKKQLISLRENTNIEKLNSIVADYNEAIILLNDFIYYRNNKFKPTLPDDEIQKMIEKPKEKLIKCQDAIYIVGSVGNENSSNLTALKKSINEALGQAEEHDQFVKNYLSKSKIARKSMFTKISWFGIPIN